MLNMEFELSAVSSNHSDALRFGRKKTDVGLLATRRAKAKHIYFVRSLRTQSKLSGVEAGG
jgi:hypothetical protein